MRIKMREREREIERKGLHGINAGICSLVHDEGKKERERDGITLDRRIVE